MNSKQLLNSLAGRLVEFTPQARQSIGLPIDQSIKIYRYEGGWCAYRGDTWVEVNAGFGATELEALQKLIAIEQEVTA